MLDPRIGGNVLRTAKNIVGSLVVRVLDQRK